MKVPAIACLVLLLTAIETSPASAEFVPFDEATRATGWMQLFTESGVGPFDHLQMYMLPPDTWRQPVAITNFSNASWSQTWNDGTYLIADGNDRSSLVFALHFPADPPEPFTFRFQAWNDNTLLHTANAAWNGSRWNITPGYWDAPRLPEPLTLALLASGALLLLTRRSV